MKNKIILQLELKDIFFHHIQYKPVDRTYVECEGMFFVVRNYFAEFLYSLSGEFDFGIWSSYNKGITECLYEYMKALGVDFLYCNNVNDITLSHANGEFARGKRLKKLNYLGIDIDRVICLEIAPPNIENYGNCFLISSFRGQADDELLQVSKQLLALSNISNTRTLND